MTTPFAVVPPTRAVGTINPPGDMNNTSLQLAAMGGAYNVLNAAYAGGADPTGTDDSSGAFQAALDAAPAGAAVLVPPGTYLIASTVTLTTSRLFGAGAAIGATATTQVKAESGLSGAMFNFAGAASEMAYMGISSAYGNDIFGGGIPGSCWFHDMALYVNGEDGCCVNVNGSDSSINNTWERCNFGTTNATRNSPLVSMWSSTSGNISNNTFYKCFFNNSANNNTQYCCYFAASGAQTNYQYATVLRDCYFEHPFGGAVQSLAGQNFLMDSCFLWDIFAGQSGDPTMGTDASLIYIGKYSGAAASQGAIIRNCGRNRDGPNGSTQWDVWCDSTTDGVRVEGYRVRANTTGTDTPAYFNFNTCTNVSLAANQNADAGNPGGTVVTNPPSNITITGATVVSGQYLAAPTQYAPGSQTTKATPSPTTVAAGSNGGEISTIASWASPSAGVLDVASTTGWPTSGTVNVAASGSTTAVVTYTGITGSSLTGCGYVSGSATGTVATGGAVDLTSPAAFDSGVICTPAFPAPPSGNVVITVNCGMQASAGGAIGVLALAAVGAVTPLYGDPYSVQLSGTTTLDSVTAKFLVTGLTPGTSYQFDLLGAAQSGDTVSIIAFSAGSATTKGAPVTFEVQAV